MKIILASTSPRRQDLLSLADIEFTIQAVDVDESVLSEEIPQDYIVRMVQAKAEAAAEVIKQSGSSDKNSTATNPEQKQKEHYLVITADTIGVLADGVSILVKPTDKNDAFAMWQKMSNTQHAVWTAVQLSVIDSVGKVIHTDNILEKTEVTFIELDNTAMETYWATGEPTDKAGGYAIQGKGAAWVERINGSYSNVVGLPLAQTIAAIKRIEQQFCE